MVCLFVHHSGVRHVDLVLHLMAQPPWDARMDLSANKPFYILHYTYGNDYTLDGKFTPGVWSVVFVVAPSPVLVAKPAAIAVCKDVGLQGLAGQAGVVGAGPAVTTRVG